ncbi:MAG: FtsX-like permease family protein [bacterium]|nr:FtsX-like permease family protein [bacterium]
MMQSVQPPGTPLDVAAELNGAVLAFTFLAALLTAVVFGLAPALRTTRPELVAALKEGAGVSGDGGSLLRKALVVWQVALATVLLIGATMVLRSLENARHVDLGFEADEQLIATVDVGLQGYDEAAGRSFFRTLRERVGELPGVEAVGYAEVVPMRLMAQQTGAVPAGYEIPDGSNPPTIDYNQVSTGYFAAMGVPIVRGRGFEPTDDEDGRRVVIINQTMARRFWPDQNPIGSTVNIYNEDHQVVGLVKDGKYFTLGENPKPYMYLPTERYYAGGLNLHVRTSQPSSLLEAVRREVQALDASLPVTDLEPMTAHLDFVLLPARIAASVVSAFAVLALVLAAVGLYAIIAFWVSQGVREIAIRMALGARIGDVVGMVVGKGMLLAGIGLIIGSVVGFLLSLLSARVLYGLQGTEVSTYLVAGAALVVVALFASFLPAQKAARVEPMSALRAE